MANETQALNGSEREADKCNWVTGPTADTIDSTVDSTLGQTDNALSLLQCTRVGLAWTELSCLSLTSTRLAQSDIYQHISTSCLVRKRCYLAAHAHTRSHTHSHTHTYTLPTYSHTLSNDRQIHCSSRHHKPSPRALPASSPSSTAETKH